MKDTRLDELKDMAATLSKKGVTAAEMRDIVLLGHRLFHSGVGISMFHIEQAINLGIHLET